MTNEEMYVRNIENDIRALKLKTKKPSELTIGANINKLKMVNIGLYEDLFAKYKIALENHKKSC
jgi:hypothetical protein